MLFMCRTASIRCPAYAAVSWNTRSWDVSLEKLLIQCTQMLISMLHLTTQEPISTNSSWMVMRCHFVQENQTQLLLSKCTIEHNSSYDVVNKITSQESSLDETRAKPWQCMQLCLTSWFNYSNCQYSCKNENVPSFYKKDVLQCNYKITA